MLFLDLFSKKVVMLAERWWEMGYVRLHPFLEVRILACFCWESQVHHYVIGERHLETGSWSLSVPFILKWGCRGHWWMDLECKMNSFNLSVHADLTDLFADMQYLRRWPWNLWDYANWWRSGQTELMRHIVSFCLLLMWDYDPPEGVMTNKLLHGCKLECYYLVGCSAVKVKFRQKGPVSPIILQFYAIDWSITWIMGSNGLPHSSSVYRTPTHP